MNDGEVYQKLIGDFVPTRVFDAHAHLFRSQDVYGGAPSQSSSLPQIAGYADWQSAQQSVLGKNAPGDGLFFAFPGIDMNLVASNEFVRNEIQAHPQSRALMMIRPDLSPDDLHFDGAWAGFKVYHCFSGIEQTQDALIEQYLPDWAWEIAHEREWVIMLHMVRQRSLADPANSDYILDRCRRYPHARLILAHAGRGFAGHHTAEGVARLRGLDNVYFDTSVVCEPVALFHILKTFGAGRLLYGSDFPVSQWRGKAITIGDGFYWIYEHDLDWSDWSLGKPTLVGIESLHAIKQAAQMLELRDADIERIFYHNAIELLGA